MPSKSIWWIALVPNQISCAEVIAVVSKMSFKDSRERMVPLYTTSRKTNLLKTDGMRRAASGRVLEAQIKGDQQ